ncbi:hypothetical protein Bca101_037049 [Brassica carinata]
MATRAKRGISKPNSKYAYAANLTQSHHFIPTTIAQALADPNWRQAVIDEFNSIVKNGTFSLVPPSPNQNPVSCRWIFTIKFNPDGSVRRYKARLVARGYTQLPNQVSAGILRVAHVSTKDQLADALTKPLSRAPFTMLSSKIGVAKAPPS